MTFIKKLSLAAALVAASSVASAATYNLGTSEFPLNSSGSASAIAVTDGTGSFFDIFNFKTASTPTADWSALAFDASAVKFDYIDLYSGFDAVAANWIGGFGAETGGTLARILAGDFNLTPYTEYSVMVSGVSYIAGDEYTFNAGPISAVPEASTVAMMLGGLGLVGFMANRRRKTAQAV